MIETFTAFLQRLLYGPVEQVFILSSEKMMPDAIDFRREILRDQYSEDVGIKIIQIEPTVIPEQRVAELLEACGDKGFLVSEITTRGAETSFRIDVGDDEEEDYEEDIDR